MSILLAVTARPDAPVACDMSGAVDTVAARIASYDELFRDALVERTPAAGSTVSRFAAHPGVQERLLALVRREVECCGFLSYEVRREADQLVWVVTGGPGELAAFEDMLRTT